MNEARERARADARLRRIAGHTSDLVCIMDRQGEIVYRASWSKHILGWPATSDRRLTSLCATPDDEQRASLWLAHLIVKGDAESSEVAVLRLRTFDGGERVCQLIGYSRFDDPLIAGILVHVRDVTDLVGAGAHAAVMSGHASDIVAIADATSRITWVSPSVERVLGFRPDEIISRSALELVHPDDHALILDRLAAVLEVPAAFRPVELRLFRSDGTAAWFEISGANLLDDPVVRGVVVSLHDVSERRAAQAALGGVRAAHRSILAMAGDAIIAVRAGGAVEDFNPAATDIFGWQAEEIIGQQCTVLFDEDVLSDLSARTNTWTESLLEPIETYAIRRGGQTFPALMSVSRVETDDGLLFTAVIRDISERRAIEARLEFVMLHDELTSLPNRRLLIERAKGAIERARNRRRQVAVAFVDLDEFQRINDDFGLDVGDRVLRHAAQILCDAAGDGATVARLAGDQFAILFDDAASVEAVTDAASRIEQSLRSFDVDGQPISAPASIGIAVWDSHDFGVLELLRNAERAMYRCKQRGGGRFALYDDAMQNLVAGRRELEAALRDGIAHDELRAFYQPIVRVRDCRVVRFEALVRWDRPTIGIVGPVEFIGIAEQSVLIIELGAWMLHRAAADCAGWQQRLPGVGITVNVSARHFDEGDIIADVRAALDASGLEARLLCLEVTESVMLADTQHTLALLAELRAMRVSVVLDDFGTGYSSLTYLRRLPIDGLKIDKSFVDTIGTGTEDTTILRAIADLGAAYELEVVAEGIDTGAKLAVLRAIGCRYGQGYLFARPLPLPEALEMWDPR